MVYANTGGLLYRLASTDDGQISLLQAVATSAAPTSTNDTTPSLTAETQSRVYAVAKVRLPFPTQTYSVAKVLLLIS